MRNEEIQPQRSHLVHPFSGGFALRKAVQELSGTRLLEGILELPNARQVVQELAPSDFLWLVKKIGEDDSLPLLELASTEQWQHLVDLEVWHKDRIHLDSVGNWLKRLHEADGERLVKWLVEDGDLFFRHYLGNMVEVMVRDHDTDEVPDGFFSLDGVYYIRVKDPLQGQFIQQVLGDMARLDYGTYLRTILGLSEYLPSEAEEELYRLRNVRLAEQGFLPFEEALMVYAPLEPEALLEGGPEVPFALELDDEDRDLVPMIPLDQGGGGGLLTHILEGIQDPVFFDRVRLEFAALANQIISAEGMPLVDLETLNRACVRAASYLNLGLESLSHGEISVARDLVSRRALISIFRVGFGLALKLQWEAKRWLKGSWFRKMGLSPSFWAEPWGRILEGVLKRRPMFFTGEAEGEEFRDFQRPSELDEARKAIYKLKELDGLLEGLFQKYPSDPGLLAHPEATFHPLLFTLWARHVMEVDAVMAPLSLEETRRFFSILRARDPRPPYKMAGWEKKFVEFFIKEREGQGDPSCLSQALEVIWREFREEYERIPIGELDPRFCRFLSVIEKEAETA